MSNVIESIKEFIKKNKKWVLLVGVGIVAAAGTIAILLAPGAGDQQRTTPEARMEQVFQDLLARATSGEIPTDLQLTPRTPRVNPFADFIQQDIVLLPLEERLRIWQEDYGIEVPDKNFNFDVLYAASPNIYAWIYIPNTRINYPIVQHPTTNTHYLYHTIDGFRSWPGAIFTENFNTMTFFDRMTIVYGHNIREGTMFTDLHNFARQSLFDENPFIYVYTEDDIFVYRIFAAQRIDNAHVLLEQHLSTDEMFLEFLSDISNPETARGVVDGTVEFDLESRIIALSVCIDGRREERFVVFGILVEQEGFFHPRLW